MKCYYNALDLTSETDYDILISIYSSLGNIYLDQELYDEAFSAFKTFYDIAIRNPDESKKCIPTLSS
ncbi:MAG: hypothetical protein LUH22_17800 [Bacteroides sp.]|nr:hypothetical protein [Bacteroides sp.]